MELIFLGTSSGVPTKVRNVSAAVLKKKNSKRWSLIDCGEGTQHQILHTNLSMKNLDAIYITHIHGDHCYGLPGLLASASMGGRTEPLQLIAPEGVVDFMRKIIECTELYLSYSLEMIIIEDNNEPIEREDFTVEKVVLSHRVPSWGYVFTEKGVEPTLNTDKLKAESIPSGKAWGMVQKGQNFILDDGREILAENYINEPRKSRKVAISGDNDDAAIWGKIDGLDLLVHESTFSYDISEKIGKEVGHSSAKEVAVFANEYGLRNLILTHFSSRYVKYSGGEIKGTIEELKKEAARIYKGGLFMADDFDIFEITKELDVKKTRNREGCY